MTDRGAPQRVRTPADPSLRSRLYRALADALAGRPRHDLAVVLIETSTAESTPFVTVRPAEVLDSLRASPTFRGLTAPTALGPPPAEGSEGSIAAWDVVATDAIAPPSDPSAVRDLPEAPAVLGQEGRLDLQTLWASGRTDGRLWASRRARFVGGTSEERDLREASVARFVASEWGRAVGAVCWTRPLRHPFRRWAEPAGRSLPRSAWLPLPAAHAASTAESGWMANAGEATEGGHVVALGASGAGKTTFLADRAARAIREGISVLVVDLHGDLAPAIVARLAPAERTSVVAVDVGLRPVVGVAALSGRDGRTAAAFVAAVKRLSPDGADVYWGFRLERLFDAFVRLALESGGNVADLYALLTDADRRDAARLATRSPELRRFLGELEPIVRRTPDFLWAAASRLAKVVLVPQLTELLSPEDGGVPVEELLEGRRSLLVRIPFFSVGPEAAAFAGSLVLARAYLGLAARRGSERTHAPVLVVLDEVQGFSPRLVAEMLSEGRKFGFRLAVATQYPERLAPEVRHAAAGVHRGVVVFRTPWASVADVAPWLGLTPTDAQRLLPELPVGVGTSRVPGSGGLRCVPADGGGVTHANGRAWTVAAARTRTEFAPRPAVDAATQDEATERLLLAILAGDEAGTPVPVDRLVDAAEGLPGPPVDRAVLDDRLTRLPRAGVAEPIAGTWHLTPAGERRLGLRSVTGATTETPEHRTLLLRAFRLFARRGHLLEIVRQGRFDTTLPDAIFRQVPERARLLPARELADVVRAVQRTWAWRFFGGRDVHVEVEVSGALRPVRIRHGLEKAAARGAFPLFVVGDTARAARVRRTLRGEGYRPDRAQVWTLTARAPGGPGIPREGKPQAGFGALCESSSPSMSARRSRG